MAFKNMKGDSLIILFVQLVTWSFTYSLPAQEANSFTFDWDWLHRYTTPRPIFWTFSPNIYNKPKNYSTPPIVWFIVGGVVLVGLLVILIKFACSMFDSPSTVYDSTPTLHPPPATTIRFVERPTTLQLPPEHRPGNMYDFPPSTNLGGILPSYPAPTNASSMYSATDKPPDYSEVVISDFVDENKKFKEVAPKPLDTPPPTYGDQNLQRY